MGKINLIGPVIFLAMISSVSSSFVYAEAFQEIIFSGLYESSNHKYSFSHKDIYNWHEQTRILIREMKLESEDRVAEVKRTGVCFKSGECQKEISVQLPLQELANYTKFIALSPQGEMYVIDPVRIETIVFLFLGRDGKLNASSSGYGRIEVAFEGVKKTGEGFVFALSKNVGKMMVRSLPAGREAVSIAKVTDKIILVNNQQIPNEMRIESKNILAAYEITFENQPDKYLALTWSADTPCANNFSIFRVDSKIENREWRGWGCDV